MWREGPGLGVQVLPEGKAEIRMQSLGSELEKQVAVYKNASMHMETTRSPHPHPAQCDYQPSASGPWNPVLAR